MDEFKRVEKSANSHTGRIGLRLIYRSTKRKDGRSLYVCLAKRILKKGGFTLGDSIDFFVDQKRRRVLMMKQTGGQWWMREMPAQFTVPLNAFDVFDNLPVMVGVKYAPEIIYEARGRIVFALPTVMFKESAKVQPTARGRR